MKVAVVDLGTNSARLLLAAVEQGIVHDAARLTTVTRLGAGVDRQRRIDPEAAARTRSCLAGYAARVARLRPRRAAARGDQRPARRRRRPRLSRRPRGRVRAAGDHSERRRRGGAVVRRGAERVGATSDRASRERSAAGRHRRRWSPADAAAPGRRRHRHRRRQPRAGGRHAARAGAVLRVQPRHRRSAADRALLRLGSAR